MTDLLPGLSLKERSKNVLLELLGTFLFVLGGGAAVCLSPTDGGGGLMSAFVWGFLMVGLMYVMMNTSGAQFNPAVSFGKALAGDLGWLDMIGYWIAQLIGAFLAGALLYWFFGKASGVGESVGVWTGPQKAKAVVFEILITTIFVYVFLSLTVPRSVYKTSEGRMEVDRSSVMFPHSFAPIAIGLTFTALVLTAYFWTGGSMNPARSLALAVYDRGNISSVWVYIVGPLVGAILAAGLHKITSMKINNSCPHQTVVTKVTTTTRQ
jgi:glycerol uptake facilitator-like aquaporin